MLVVFTSSKFKDFFFFERMTFDKRKWLARRDRKEKQKNSSSLCQEEGHPRFKKELISTQLRNYRAVVKDQSTYLMRQYGEHAAALIHLEVPPKYQVEAGLRGLWIRSKVPGATADSHLLVGSSSNLGKRTIGVVNSRFSSPAPKTPRLSTSKLSDSLTGRGSSRPSQVHLEWPEGLQPRKDNCAADIQRLSIGNTQSQSSVPSTPLAAGSKQPGIPGATSSSRPKSTIHVVQQQPQHGQNNTKAVSGTAPNQQKKGNTQPVQQPVEPPTQKEQKKGNTQPVQQPVESSSRGDSAFLHRRVQLDQSSESKSESSSSASASESEEDESMDEEIVFPSFPSRPPSPTPYEHLDELEAASTYPRSSALLTAEKREAVLRLDAEDKKDTYLKRLAHLDFCVHEWERKKKLVQSDYWTDWKARQKDEIKVLKREYFSANKLHLEAKTHLEKAEFEWRRDQAKAFDAFHSACYQMIGDLEMWTDPLTLSEVHKDSDYQDAVRQGDIVKAGSIMSSIVMNVDTDNLLVEKQQRLSDLFAMRRSHQESFSSYSHRYLEKYTELSSICEPTFLEGANEVNLIENLCKAVYDFFPTISDLWVFSPSQKPKTVSDLLTAVSEFDKRRPDPQGSSGTSGGPKPEVKTLMTKGGRGGGKGGRGDGKGGGRGGGRGGSNTKSPELCRNFAKSGSCRAGDKCKFLHATSNSSSSGGSNSGNTSNQYCSSVLTTGNCVLGLQCPNASKHAASHQYLQNQLNHATNNSSGEGNPLNRLD